MSDKIIEKIETQNREFEAVDILAVENNRLKRTAVVDDDYEEVRYDYECALRDLIDRMRVNGRFTKGNRYGVEVVG